MIDIIILVHIIDTFSVDVISIIVYEGLYCWVFAVVKVEVPLFVLSLSE